MELFDHLVFDPLRRLCLVSLLIWPVLLLCTLLLVRVLLLVILLLDLMDSSAAQSSTTFQASPSLNILHWNMRVTYRLFCKPYVSLGRRPVRAQISASCSYEPDFLNIAHPRGCLRSELEHSMCSVTLDTHRVHYFCLIVWPQKRACLTPNLHNSSKPTYRERDPQPFSDAWFSIAAVRGASTNVV